MPLVNITMLEGRSPDKIEALIKNVTETVANTLEAPKQNVRIVIHEVPKTHFGIGGESAKNLGR